MFNYLLELIGMGKRPFFTPPTAPADPKVVMFGDGAAQKWARPAHDNFEDLPQEQIAFIQTHASCPYCHGALYNGPHGGGSVNLFCENVDVCNSRFNVPDMIPWGQFTGPCPPSFIEAIHSQQESA